MWPLIIVGAVVAALVVTSNGSILKNVFQPFQAPPGAGGPGGKSPPLGRNPGGFGPPNYNLGSPFTSPDATLQTIDGSLIVANRALGFLGNLVDYTGSSPADSEYPVTPAPVMVPGPQITPDAPANIYQQDFTTPDVSSYTDPSAGGNYTDSLGI